MKNKNKVLIEKLTSLRELAMKHHPTNFFYKFGRTGHAKHDDVSIASDLLDWASHGEYIDMIALIKCNRVWEALCKLSEKKKKKKGS